MTKRKYQTKILAELIVFFMLCVFLFVVLFGFFSMFPNLCISFGTDNAKASASICTLIGLLVLYFIRSIKTPNIAGTLEIFDSAGERPVYRFVIENLDSLHNSEYLFIKVNKNGLSSNDIMVNNH